MTSGILCFSIGTETNAYAVADPGFPRGEGGGANLLFGQFFSKTA